MDMEVDDPGGGPGAAEDMDWVETLWKGWSNQDDGPGATEVVIHVVIDTNILIQRESLQGLRRACSASPAGTGYRLAVCVPWTVLSELDGLKQSDSGEKRAQARNAMKYLEEAFTASEGGQGPAPTGRAQFFGQSMAEFKDAIGLFGVVGVRNSPDDLILQCTLQKRKTLEGRYDDGAGSASRPSTVVLLTGDRNLCLKSRACGVPAFTALEAGTLDALAQTHRRASLIPPSRADRDARDSPHESVTGPAVFDKAVPRGSLDASRLGEVTNQVMEVMRGCLSRFIEDTFRENFGDEEWSTMVAVPPPWSMRDLFKLLKQHWFSLNLDKETQSAVDIIEHVHERACGQEKGKEAALPRQTFFMFFDKSLQLVNVLAARSMNFQGEVLQLRHLRGEVYAT